MACQSVFQATNLMAIDCAHEVHNLAEAPTAFYKQVLEASSQWGKKYGLVRRIRHECSIGKADGGIRAVGSAGIKHEYRVINEARDGRRPSFQETSFVYYNCDR